jgi:hypothetical protein
MPRPNVCALGTTSPPWVLDNNPTALGTMQTMAQLVYQALTVPAIVRYANALIENTRSRDYVHQIACVRQFGEQYFRFLNNPIGIQRIKPPQDMLCDIERKGYTWGACDDAAILMATLGMANALRAQFRAVAFGARGPDDSARLSHVICDLFDGDDWEPLDITKPYDLLRKPNVVKTLTLEL